jgi:hypothetical protein
MMSSVEVGSGSLTDFSRCHVFIATCDLATAITLSKSISTAGRDAFAPEAMTAGTWDSSMVRTGDSTIGSLCTASMKAAAFWTSFMRSCMM